MGHISLMTPISAMPPGRFRKLSLGERALAKSVFGDGLAVDRVWLFSIPIWNRAFVAGPGLIVWPARSASNDFSTASIEVQAVLIHELVHVWQAQRGINLVWAKLRAGDSPTTYSYDLFNGYPFQKLNIEQQAMIVEHGFLAAHGRLAPFESHDYSVALIDLNGKIWERPHQV